MNNRTFNIENETVEIIASNDYVKGNILFIHGFTSSSFSHIEFEAKNSFDDYNYYSINLSGHKLTRNNQEKISSISFNKLVDEIVEFINKKEMFNLILIGHSMGAALCLAVKEKCSIFVAGLILVAPLNPTIMKSKIGISYIYSLLFNKKQMIKKMLVHKEKVEFALVNEYLDFEISKLLKKKAKYLAFGLKLIDYSLIRRIETMYKNIDCPTVVLLGSKDKVIRYKPTKKFFNKISNPHIVVHAMSDSGHLPFIDNFEEYNNHVWWFIKARNLK